MIKIFGPFSSGVAVGANGVATANKTTVITLVGKLLGVYVKYEDSPPAGTTDVTIATLGTAPSPPSLTILTLTNASTDGYFWVRHIVKDEVGAAVTFDGTNEVYEPVVIYDRVKVTIAGANADDYADVWFLMEV